MAVMLHLFQLFLMQQCCARSLGAALLPLLHAQQPTRAGLSCKTLSSSVGSLEITQV